MNILDDIKAAVADVTAAGDALDKARQHRNSLIRQALSNNVDAAVVATAASMSASHVYQIGDRD